MQTVQKKVAIVLHPGKMAHSMTTMCHQLWHQYVSSETHVVTHWQNEGLTWTCPRPRTWAAAIRSFFWLAYRKGGRDGKHENTGEEGGGGGGSNNKNHTHTKVLDHKDLISVILTHKHMCIWAKQAWAYNEPGTDILSVSSGRYCRCFCYC